MVLPERLQETLVGDLRRVIHHEHHLVVAGLAAADLLIGRIGREAAGVSHRGRVDAVAQFPELTLGAPEAAHAEHRGLQALGPRSHERMTVDEMSGRSRDRRGAALERCRGGRHFGLLPGEEHDRLLSRPHPESAVPPAPPCAGRGPTKSLEGSGALKSCLIRDISADEHFRIPQRDHDGATAGVGSLT
jgi:hypothetical protein